MSFFNTIMLDNKFLFQIICGRLFWSITIGGDDKHVHGKYSFNSLDGTQKYHVLPAPRVGGAGIITVFAMICFFLTKTACATLSPAISFDSKHSDNPNYPRLYCFDIDNDISFNRHCIYNHSGERCKW